MPPPLIFTRHHQQFLLREFRQDDMEAVCAIEKFNQISPWSKENFSSSLINSHYCVVVDNLEQSELVAYAIYQVLVDSAELLNIGVKSSWHRKGIGRHLLGNIVNSLEPDIKSLFLEVRVFNKTAREFYESLGFAEIGLRPNYYPAPRNHPIKKKSVAKSNSISNRHMLSKKTAREDALIMAMDCSNRLNQPS